MSGGTRCEGRTSINLVEGIIGLEVWASPGELYRDRRSSEKLRLASRGTGGAEGRDDPPKTSLGVHWDHEDA